MDLQIPARINVGKMNKSLEVGVVITGRKDEVR